MTATIIGAMLAGAIIGAIAAACATINKEE